MAFCPIRASLGVLGRKWTLLILRDLAYLKVDRFSGYLENNPGLTPRVLSRRLQEMQEEGLVERIAQGADAKDVRYALTERGAHALPILVAFIQYGLRHHADVVFEDGEPRELGDVFPELATPNP